MDLITRWGSFKKGVNIDERSAVVEDRDRIDDLKADTIIGKCHKYAIVSLAERKSRRSLIYKVERKTRDDVTDTVTKLLTPIKNRVHTMNSDNGKEFANHEMIAHLLGTDFYCVHPYVYYERGLNETTNELVKQYFSKNFLVRG